MILSKLSTRLILISVYLLNTAGMCLYTYLSKYLQFISTDITIIPLVLSIFALCSVLFPPFIGKNSDKKQNRRIFIIIGGIGLVFTFVLFLFVKDLIFIIILNFIYGFFAASSGMMLVLYAEIVENDEKYIAYYNAMVALGWFSGALFGGMFIDVFGIQNMFIFPFIFSLINVGFAFFIKEDRSIIIQKSKERMISSEKDLSLVDLKEWAPISKSIYPSLFLRNFGYRPVLSILPIIMSIHLASDAEIGFLTGINPLIQFFLIILIGKFITDKNLKPLMVIGYFLTAIVIFGYIIANNFLGYLVFQVLVSFSYSMFWTATQVYIAKNTTPENKGKYIGYGNSSFFLGSFTGALLFSSLISSYSSDYYMAMYFMIIFPAISSLIILLKFKSQEKK